MLDTIDCPLNQQWLRTEELRLVEFARHVVREDNLGAWLGDAGLPEATQAGYTYITGRMAYVRSLAALRRTPGSRERATRLLNAPNATARPPTHGGWRERHDDDGTADKSAY